VAEPHGRIRPAAAVAACAIAGLLGCAGCTAGGPAASTSSTGSASALALPTRSLASPGCTDAAVGRAALSRVRTAMTPVPDGPFGVAVTPDGRWAFVADAAGVEVLRTDRSLAPVPVRTIRLPGSPEGATISPDGRYLLVADGSGAVVISVARAEQGQPGAVLGTLTDPAGGAGGIEVAVSPDGGFAFVTQEDSQQAAVFNLRLALTRGFGPADYVGAIPLGLAPVGMAVSPDGRWLYATSEAARRNARGQGSLAVISLPRAETDPAASVVTTVAAGCSPVRVVTSADGREVWVTARESDDLLCFSAAALRSDPARALVAVVRVGEAPVGLMLVRNGSRVVVADSNRFNATGANSDLSVVNVAAALAARPAVIGRIPAGQFPREMALVPGGQRLLVSNFASGQVEAVSVPTIP
jgi:DNA-binding beta-propeller fold protein YncE